MTILTNKMNSKIKTRLKLLDNKYIYIPLIDVVFLLLIFFTLSSSFIQISAININLPKVKATLTSAEKLIITIDKNNNFYFNDQVMNLKELKEQLVEITSKNNVDGVIIRADNDAPHGTVSKTLALANSLDLNVYFAVSSPKNKNLNQIPFESY